MARAVEREAVTVDFGSSPQGVERVGPQRAEHGAAMQRAIAIAAVTTACLVTALPAAAAEPAIPEGTATQDPATTGTQDLEGEGAFGSATQLSEEESGDTLEWDLSFGALVATGNARQTSLNGGTNFLIRRGRHQFGTTGYANYGWAEVETEEADGTTTDSFEPTLGNVQGRVRYDFFLSPHWSLFAMATARHDRFQYLDLRLNLDPGAAWYVINKAHERLALEAGYDFQFDVRSDDAVVRDDAGMPVLNADESVMPLPNTRSTHAVRLAGSYSNALNEAITVRTDLEYLQSVQEALRWRLNWNVGLNAALYKSLALATTFTLRIDNDPLPGVRSVDTVTAVSLVYRFF